MPSPTRTERNNAIPFEALMAIGEGAPSLAVKLQTVQQLRDQSKETSVGIDKFLFEQLIAQQEGLLAARSNIGELKNILELMTAPPLLPARFLGRLPGARPLVQVVLNNSRLILGVAPGVKLDDVRVGDEVVINKKENVVIGPSPFPPGAHGQTGYFQRMLSDGRMVLRGIGDGDTIIGVATAAAGEQWRQGDLVRWDTASQLALEKVQQDTASEFRLEAIPDLPLESVGGQQANLQRLIAALMLTLTQPETARRYGLGGMRAVLMHGPPGTGKTLMAKVAGAQLQRTLGRACHIMVVKPGGFENEFVGVTQRKIRECFAALRRAEGFGLLFLDEIESIARTRGGPVNHHSDKFLAALLVELQGLASDGASCAVIAATNRLDMLDPALVSRMEVQLHVGRPDPRAARDIISIHMPRELPYHSNGHPGSVTREQIVDRCVAMFYNPQSSVLCTVKFRDGSQRVVTARDLVSGRCFEQTCRLARQAAAYREVNGGEPGLTVHDIEEAASEAIEKLASSLTRFNIHQHVCDLRQDMEVVAVEPIVKRVPRPYRYINHGEN